VAFRKLLVATLIHAAPMRVASLFAEQLIALYDSAELAGDGTFKIKPYPYASKTRSQVFTLNTFDRSTLGTRHARLRRRVLVLLPARTECCYRKMFEILFRKAEQLYGLDKRNICWKKLMVDFEPAIANAVLSFNFVSFRNTIKSQSISHYYSFFLKRLKLY
jgi:hypothetical protein